MKRILFFQIFLLIIFSCSIFAFSFRLALPDSASRFFPVKDLMTVGVYYYPEHWAQEEWDRDFSTMEKMGFEFVHMAEFAWAFMEPEEGKFDFNWLDKAVELAAKHNLKIVMCTPTPCPPAWMAEKYPEIFMVDSNGRILEHGSRANNALGDSIYQRLCERIITKLGQHYGNNPNVIGWQLDNEPYAQADFSPSAQSGLRTWLQKKYKTIDELNTEWGAAFWSMKYNNFAQIRITSILYGASPHAILDFKRFTADQTAHFLNWQADILRHYTSTAQWITTNYISNIGGADARRSDKLDFASFTLYPVSGGHNLGTDGFRLGWYQGMTFAGAFYKNIKGITGVMELQPGQVNWATINPQPMPGVIRMWLWHAYANGCSFACTYRFRQPLYGNEQYHDGIIGTDGVTPSKGGLEYQQVISEIKQLRKQYDPAVKIPAIYNSRRTAILWNHENLWNLDNQKQTNLWDTWGHMFRYMEIAKSLGAPLDIIKESDDFSAYRVLIAPAYQLIDEKLVAKWKKYVEQGGNLILTCRTGQKKRSGQLWEAKRSEPICSLIGADIPFFDMLLDDGNGEVKIDTARYRWNVWGDILQPFKETESLAKYSNQFYSGETAVTYHKLGKGSVTYIGVQTKDWTFEKEIAKLVYKRAGIITEDYPRGVFVYWRDGFWIAVNYSSSPVSIPLQENSVIILGKKLLNPADVLVWK